MSEWWRNSVIYQIYPRSFADSNADGIGDLRGIIGKLPYVASLGVDAVWLSPFFKSPMKDFGYDVSDYRSVDSIFGSLSDFDALIQKAHRLGLRIIIDQVINHSSEAHSWFKESRSSRGNPKADWYVWADPKPDGTPPNNWLSVFGGSSWTWDCHRRQYYFHNFLPSQPDLNLHHPKVQSQVLSDMEFWLKRGVDGVRLDACQYYFHDQKLRDNPSSGRRSEMEAYWMQRHLYDKYRPEIYQFLEKIRKLADSYGACALGELGGPAGECPPYMELYAKGNRRLHFTYSFDLMQKEYSAEFFFKKIREYENEVPTGHVCYTMNNHDNVRLPSRWSASPGFIRMIVRLLFSLRGSVCLYQGEELGLPEATLSRDQIQDPVGITMWPEFKGRDGCRTPMPWNSRARNAGFSKVAPWLPVPKAHYPLAVDTQNTRGGSLLNYYRGLVAWRKAHSDFCGAPLTQLRLQNNTLSFRRGKYQCRFDFRAPYKATVEEL